VQWLWLAGAVLLGAILRFWRLGDLALTGDESYYWLWSRHLDWAYFDHPAGVAVQTWLSTLLGGQAEGGIRWLNALLGTGCILLVWFLGRQLFSEQAGTVASLAVAVGAPFLLTSRLVYTDVLHLFLLLLSLAFFWRLVQERPRPSLVTAVVYGLSMALLLNTKYSAYLYALAIAVSVVADYRHLLVDRRFWLAVAISALGLLPTLVWNANHGWASFRWQLSHLAFGVSGEQSLVGSAYHSLTYLTWPLVALALLGVGLVRSSTERLLSLIALFLLLPVALSPANSPRNLSTGLVALLLLTGARWPGTLHIRGRRRLLAAGQILLLLLTAVYGVGTVLSLSGQSTGLRSSAVTEIRRDTTGWREIGPVLAQGENLIYALDYSIASQAWYYSGQPVFTSWGQYRIWGIPDFEDITIISLAYLPEELVTARLQDAFEYTEGPHRLRFGAGDTAKEIRLWEARGRLVDREIFLDQFDFLGLQRDSR
jgi:4-amino-4-deoxy-L-arabinose transferase-like glycosyltransferase